MRIFTRTEYPKFYCKPMETPTKPMIMCNFTEQRKLCMNEEYGILPILFRQCYNQSCQEETNA